MVLKLHQSIKSLPYHEIEDLNQEPLVSFMDQEWDVSKSLQKMSSLSKRQLSKIITPIAVSYTHLTLPTNSGV